jgi:DNA-3-methyladenine glycosylase
VARVGRRAGGPALSLAELLAGPAPEAARGLLGCLLSAGDVTVRISETEAYAGTSDAASHAFRGPTGRNAVMFGPAGHAYVYFTYGMHWCLNVVCGPDGEAAAVLVRAGAVVDGLDVARVRRAAAAKDRDLARGPARLCAALGVDRGAYGVDLLDPASPVRLTAPVAPVPPESVHCGPRVGVTGAHDVPWRYWIEGDPTVSVYRRHVPRAARKN